MEHSQLESIWAELSSPPPLPTPLIQSFSSIHFDRSSFAMFQFSELFCIIHPHTKPAPKSDVISPQRNPLKKTTAYNSFHFAFQECHSRAFSSQLLPLALSCWATRQKKTADQHPNIPVLVIRKIRPPTPPPPQAGQKKSTRRFIDNLMPQNEFTNKFSFKMGGGGGESSQKDSTETDCRAGGKWDGKSSRKNEHGNVISAQ